MIELGKQQNLMIVKTVDYGVYLGESREAGPDERILLPKKQVPKDAALGDTLRVFVYRDSSDRLIATTREPRLQINKTAVLTVAQVGRIGAFMDWGLEKDLLLPFKEQTYRVQEGDECLVALYEDKSHRLCATTKVYPYLKNNSPYQIGDMVKGRIYQKSDRFGVFVAVEDQYNGLVPAKEAQGNLEIGSVMEFRVTQVREDGKLNLSSKQKAYLQIDEDAEMVLSVIDEFAGVLPFDDKASPEVIKREFGLSKAAFKRAVGRLLKEQKVEIVDRKIRRR